LGPEARKDGVHPAIQRKKKERNRLVQADGGVDLKKDSRPESGMHREEGAHRKEEMIDGRTMGKGLDGCYAEKYQGHPSKSRLSCSGNNLHELDSDAAEKRKLKVG